MSMDSFKMKSNSFEEDDDHFSDWNEEEDEEQQVKGWFDDMMFPSVNITQFHDYHKLFYNFDIIGITKEWSKVDFVTLIQLVNFIRWRVIDITSSTANDKCEANGSADKTQSTTLLNQENQESLRGLNLEENKSKDSDLVRISSGDIAALVNDIKSKSFLGLERYMIPALRDDVLLLNPKRYLLPSGSLSDESDSDSVDIVPDKEQSNDQLRAQLAVYKDLITQLTQDNISDSSASSDSEEDNDDSSNEEGLSGYYASYGGIDIHETMLRDDTRTLAYQEALFSSIVKDKVILDVGCGTGILSLFAAKSGAKRVIGIDNSPIISIARKIVERNKYDRIIQLVRGTVEEALLPLEPNEKVDIIVSEWMGYGLYFENMLASVIQARDKYLSPSGVMMPSHAQLFLEAIDPNIPRPSQSSLKPSKDLSSIDRVGQWTNVYDFDMSDVIGMATKDAQIQEVAGDISTSKRLLIHELDTKTATDKELDFTVPFNLAIDKESDLRALVITFDVAFRGLEIERPEIVLSTSLATKLTHWEHVALWLSPEHVCKMSQGDIVQGKLEYRRRSVKPTSQKRREYDIHLHWNIVRKDSKDAASDDSFMNHQKFVLH